MQRRASYSRALGWTGLVLSLGLLQVGCGGDRSRAPGTRGPNTGSNTDSGSSTDAGVFGDAGAGLDAGPGDAVVQDGGPTDTGGVDAGIRDAAPPVDAGGPVDTGVSADTGVPIDAGTPDSGPPAGAVNLRFTGCSPDFGGEIVVSYNGSLGIGSLGAGGSTLLASLQFDLGNYRNSIPLSTQHRIDTGVVVNLVAPNTWTNIAQDSRVYTGEIPDPIRGVLQVDNYQAAQGITDITFIDVTLQNVVDDSLCTINGSVQTQRIGR